MVELRVPEVRGFREYATVLKASLKERPQALLQLSSPLIRQSAPLMADFTVKKRLPAISMFRLFAESGGLMAYGKTIE